MIRKLGNHSSPKFDSTVLSGTPYYEASSPSCFHYLGNEWTSPAFPNFIVRFLRVTGEGMQRIRGGRDRYELVQ